MTHDIRQTLSGLRFTLYAPACTTHLHPKPELVAEFEQVGNATIRVSFDYEPGQALILRPDPNDCQEGFDESFDITEVENLEPVTLECEGMTLTIPKGFDLLNLMGEQQAGMILCDLYDRKEAA